MGMGSQSGGGIDSLGVSTVLAEINVTPLVDVMLVLLIIFMVTAPMLTQGIEIDLPQAVSTNLDEPEEALILEIDAEQNLFIGERQLDPDRLDTQLPAIMENRVDKRIFLRADKVVPYGFVVKILSASQKGGVIDIGLVTEPATGDKDKTP